MEEAHANMATEKVQPPLGGKTPQEELRAACVSYEVRQGVLLTAAITAGLEPESYTV